MICKKCGREYPDDMLNCLWCDAPNEQHVAPEAPEKIDLSNVLDVQKNIDTIILHRIGKDSTASESEGTEDVEKKVDKHPAGNFMWCAAILGMGGLLSALFAPFYIYFFHRIEIRKNHSIGKFTSAYISSIIALKVIVNGLAKITRKILEIHFFREDFVALINFALDTGLLLIHFLLCGYVAAFIIKRLTPDYEPSEYKVTSASATIYSIPVMIVMSLLSFYLFEK